MLSMPPGSAALRAGRVECAGNGKGVAGDDAAAKEFQGGDVRGLRGGVAAIYEAGHKGEVLPALIFWLRARVQRRAKDGDVEGQRAQAFSGEAQRFGQRPGQQR